MTILYDSAMHWHNEATVGDTERTNYFSVIVLVRSSCCRKSIVGGIVNGRKIPIDAKTNRSRNAWIDTFHKEAPTNKRRSHGLKVVEVALG